MKDTVNAAAASFGIIGNAVLSIRLKIEISPENEAIHEVLRGIETACDEQMAALQSVSKQMSDHDMGKHPAGKAVLSRYPDATGARVSFFETAKNKIRKGFSPGSPLQDQVRNCLKSGAIRIALLIQFPDGPALVETFPAYQLAG